MPAYYDIEVIFWNGFTLLELFVRITEQNRVSSGLDFESRIIFTCITFNLIYQCEVNSLSDPIDNIVEVVVDFFLKQWDRVSTKTVEGSLMEKLHHKGDFLKLLLTLPYSFLTWSSRSRKLFSTIKSEDHSLYWLKKQVIVSHSWLPNVWRSH